MIQRPSLDDLATLARAAGDEIMRVRSKGLAITRKLDGSIVTLADHRAEAIIEEGLLRLAPNVPLIAEEAVAAGRIPKCGDTFFCVDPLDGTRGFAEGGDEFTVNIALIEAGAPVLGVVYAPASDELFTGESGHAKRTVKGVTEAISVTIDQPAQWRVVASENSGRNADTAEFIAALGASEHHLSSSIKFCRIAEGAADLYPRFGEVSEWDAAAGHAVLAAAGGGVMRIDGSSLAYGSRAGEFIIRGLVGYGSAAAAQAARTALNG